MLSFLSKISNNFICKIGEKFCLDGDIQSAELHGNGNVNDTYLLHCKNGTSVNRYTLQRINHQVFKKPEELMENFSRVTDHIRSKISNKKLKKMLVFDQSQRRALLS